MGASSYAAALKSAIDDERELTRRCEQLVQETRITTAITYRLCKDVPAICRRQRRDLGRTKRR